MYGTYNTTEELSSLIDNFYKPNCSLHPNLSNDILIKSPQAYDIQANPGNSHCFANISDIKKNMKIKK